MFLFLKTLLAFSKASIAIQIRLRILESYFPSTATLLLIYFKICVFYFCFSNSYLVSSVVHFLDIHTFCIQTIDIQFFFLLCFFYYLLQFLPTFALNPLSSAYLMLILWLPIMNPVMTFGSLSDATIQIISYEDTPLSYARFFFSGMHQETKFVNESHLIKCYFFTVDF